MIDSTVKIVNYKCLSILEGNNNQQQTATLPQIQQTGQQSTPAPPSQSTPQQPEQQTNDQQPQPNQGQPQQQDIPNVSTTTTTQQPPVAIQPQQFTNDIATNTRLVQQAEEQLLQQLAAQQSQQGQSPTESINQQQQVAKQLLPDSSQSSLQVAGATTPGVVVQQPFIQIRIKPMPRPVVLNEQPDDRSNLNQRPEESTKTYDEPIISSQSTIKSRAFSQVRQRSQYPSPTVTRYVKQVAKPVSNETLNKRKLMLKEKEERLVYPTPPGLMKKHEIHVTEAPLPLINYKTDRKRSHLLYTQSKYLLCVLLWRVIKLFLKYELFKRESFIQSIYSSFQISGQWGPPRKKRVFFGKLYFENVSKKSKK